MLVELREQAIIILEYSWPMIILTVLVATLLRVEYIKRHDEHAVLYKELFKLFFILYILCLFQVVTYQDISWSQGNFIPFKEILRYEFGSGLFYKNILGNVLLFLPLGIFFTEYLSLKKPIYIIGYSFIISLCIEFTQMIIGRIFDIDDIILNVLGGLLGYVIWRLFQRFASKLPSFLKKDWLINIFALLLIGGGIWFLIP